MCPVEPPPRARLACLRRVTERVDARHEPLAEPYRDGGDSRERRRRRRVKPRDRRRAHGGGDEHVKVVEREHRADEPTRLVGRQPHEHEWCDDGGEEHHAAEQQGHSEVSDQF